MPLVDMIRIKLPTSKFLNSCHKQTSYYFYKSFSNNLLFFIYFRDRLINVVLGRKFFQVVAPICIGNSWMKWEKDWYKYILLHIMMELKTMKEPIMFLHMQDKFSCAWEMKPAQNWSFSKTIIGKNSYFWGQNNAFSHLLKTLYH